MTPLAELWRLATRRRCAPPAARVPTRFVGKAGELAAGGNGGVGPPFLARCISIPAFRLAGLPSAFDKS